MKPLLVVGLGNPLMGDEGIGWHLAERLAASPGLPDHVEVLQGGTDLLRFADRFAGRERVLLVDAIMDCDHAGDLTVVELPAAGFDEEQRSAHQLSVLQAVRLLRLLEPGCDRVPFTLIAVSVGVAAVGAELSPSLLARLPVLEEALLRVMRAAN